jgi:hypothetical protein
LPGSFGQSPGRRIPNFHIDFSAPAFRIFTGISSEPAASDSGTPATQRCVTVELHRKINLNFE